MGEIELNSLIQDAESNDDVSPQDLSGDESSEKSLVATVVDGQKSNFLLTVTTIMKTVIGAGIISLPLTLSKLGYVLGLLVAILVITIVQFSAVMLLKAKNLSRHSNYSSISYHIFRTRFIQIICSLAILINNGGICIVELTILKETIQKIIQSFIEDESIHDKFYLNKIFIVCAVALLEIPFALVNKIEKLKFLAFIGVSGISTFVIILAIIFTIEMDKVQWYCNSQMVPFASDIFQMAIVIPNLMLALAYQMNFFPIFKGMKNAKDSKMAKASITGVLACAIFYLLVGNMGYCLFGQNLQGNFLMAFERKKYNTALYLLMNIGFLSSVFFSFPIMFFGARNNFIAIAKQLIFVIKKKNYDYEVVDVDGVQEISSYILNENKEKRKKIAKVHFYVYTLILFLIIVGIAIAVDNIEDVFSVVGSIASNAISFIFPSMFYFFLVKKKNKTRKFHFYLAGVIFIFFIPFGIFSMISKIVV